MTEKMLAGMVYSAVDKQLLDITISPLLIMQDASLIYSLLSSAITDKINDRETFMKGIDYSYYYEPED